jgi:hypothetical protein
MDRTFYLLKFNSLHGSVQHYFHFLFGVFIPLIIENSKRTNKKTYLIQDDLGPMLKILLELPLDVKFLTNETNYEKIYLIPLDVQPIPTKKDLELIKKGWAKHITREDVITIQNYMNDMIKNKNLISNNYDYDIVIIERLTNESYETINVSKNEYEDIMKTSGSDRRVIINHKEFVEKIKQLYPTKKIINVSLEIMSIFEQYKLFQNANVIVAQHGACLGNIVFMKKKSCVIELISHAKIKSDNWFLPISKICDVMHYQYLTDYEKTTIDLNDFEMFMTSNVKFDNWFNSYSNKFKHKLNVLNLNTNIYYENAKVYNIKDKNIKYEIIHIDISSIKNVIDTLNEMILLLHENGFLFIHHENVNFEQKIEMDCFLNIEKMNCNIYVEMSIIVLEKITHK